MNDELTAFIIKELSKHRDRQDLVRNVCKRGGLHQREAERLITLLDARRRRSIKLPQTPWLLLLSIAILILGIALLGFNLQSVLAFFQNDVLHQVLSLRSNSYQVIGLITGFGMTLGGMIGLWKSFEAIFPE